MDSNEYMNENSNDTNTGTGNNATPIIPLPNPGEGGSVFPGNNMGSNMGNNMGNNMNSNMGNNMNGNNMNSGMGGNMNQGMGGNMNQGMGGNMNSGMGNNMGNNTVTPSMPEAPSTPTIPLPNPGEGGPVFSGNNASGLQGTIITVLPRPVTSCFYCNSTSYGTVRFLNAAIGYSPFVISINNRTVVETLEYAEVSDYGRVSSGTQTVTVSARNGYVYVSKQVRVTVGSTMTIAIVNTAGGLDFVEVNDTACYTPLGGSCVRVCNLSYNAGPLTLSTYSGNVVFRNVNFMEVTNYTRVVPARYDIFVSNVNEVLLSTEITVRSNSQYTIYLFNWTESPTSIRTLTIEDRK